MTEDKFSKRYKYIPVNIRMYWKNKFIKHLEENFICEVFRSYCIFILEQLFADSCLCMRWGYNTALNVHSKIFENYNGALIGLKKHSKFITYRKG